ncbi:hypothetical protein QUA35_04375 [Microcoleus sp. N9_B2]
MDNSVRPNLRYCIIKKKEEGRRKKEAGRGKKRNLTSELTHQA